jgi:hypothetical protein
MRAYDHGRSARGLRSVRTKTDHSAVQCLEVLGDRCGKALASSSAELFHEMNLSPQTDLWELGLIDFKGGSLGGQPWNLKNIYLLLDCINENHTHLTDITEYVDELGTFLFLERFLHEPEPLVQVEGRNILFIVHLDLLKRLYHKGYNHVLFFCVFPRDRSSNISQKYKLDNF